MRTALRDTGFRMPWAREQRESFRCVLQEVHYSEFGDALAGRPAQFAFQNQSVKPVAFRVLGPENLLRLTLPAESHGEEGIDAKNAAWEALVHGGLTVLKKKFAYFGHKQEHNITDTKVYFVAVPDPDSREIFRSADGNGDQWATPQEARLLLADYHALGSVPKLLKRLALALSGTSQQLKGKALEVQPRRTQLTPDVVSPEPLNP